MKYYNSSNHYKDACEVGRTEYAAAYRTLLMVIRAMQHGCTLGDIISEAGIHEVVIVGAGDIADLLYVMLTEEGMPVNSILEKSSKSMRRRIIRMIQDFSVSRKGIAVMRILTEPIL